MWRDPSSTPAFAGERVGLSKLPFCLSAVLLRRQERWRCSTIFSGPLLSQERSLHRQEVGNREVALAGVVIEP